MTKLTEGRYKSNVKKPPNIDSPRPPPPPKINKHGLTFTKQELDSHVAKEIRRIVRELEEEGFDEDVDEFKHWLLLSCYALENGGSIILIKDGFVNNK